MSDTVVLSSPSTAPSLDGPRGPKPRRTFSGRNIMLYGTLIFAALYDLLPLYVMVMTSLKGMPEIRLGNIFAPPVEITSSTMTTRLLVRSPPSTAKQVP